MEFVLGILAIKNGILNSYPSLQENMRTISP